MWSHADLLDERGGTPLLPPITEHVPLELIETRTFGSRVIYERYGRAQAERGQVLPRPAVAHQRGARAKTLNSRCVRVE
jgi:hypothetical protein